MPEEAVTPPLYPTPTSASCKYCRQNLMLIVLDPQVPGSPFRKAGTVKICPRCDTAGVQQEVPSERP